MTRSINPVPQYFDNSGNIVVSGKMFFFKSETNSKLDTFSDNLNKNKNTNPVLLDSSGRMPPVFFDGSAKQILKGSVLISGVLTADQQIWERDPVGAENVTGDFALYDNLIIYAVNDIVEGSDGKFYISISAANQGNDPVTPSPTKWSEIRFIGVYNASNTYIIGDVVQEANGSLWASKTNPNIGNTPSTDSGINWIPAITGAKIAEVTTIETRTTTVIPQTGGGTLTALRENELRDANTYTLPLASSVLVNQTITISLPDEFSASQPTVQRAGSDTITDSAGTDTSILFDSGSIEITLTSDAVSDWAL